VAPWSADRVWEAVEAWRWIPPAATHVVTDQYEVAVTPGSYSLTYVYSFRVDRPDLVDDVLRDVRKRIESLGGTGARLRVSPRSRPPDLAEHLRRHGYQPSEETDVLVWDLRDDTGATRLPELPFPTPVTVREVATDPEFDEFVKLGPAIFGDPPPSAESRAAFLVDFHRKLREEGHSERFLAWDGTVPVGRGGMELAGPVARFWGSGVLPEHRRRGGYGALVRARCESAAARGAEIALVTARVGSSAPILKRYGFSRVGSSQMFQARW
jgi:hypothetical protein